MKLCIFYELQKAKTTFVMKLLTSQKDQIYQYLVNTGYFSPQQFELLEENSMGRFTTKLIHRESNYYLNFYEDTEYNGFWLNYSPGREKLYEATDRINWAIGFDHFITWLGNLKRELDSPNLWDRFTKDATSLSLSIEHDSSKFSTKEFIELKSKVEALANEVRNLPLSEYQQSEIISNLNRLTELAEDLNKFDWKNLFIGTIISIVIQLSVTPENAKLLWDMIKRIFSTYFLE